MTWTWRRVLSVAILLGFLVSLLLAILQDGGKKSDAVISTVGFGVVGAGLVSIDYFSEGWALKTWYTVWWVTFVVSLLCAIALDGQASTTSVFVALGSGAFLGATVAVNHFVDDEEQIAGKALENLFDIGQIQINHRNVHRITDDPKLSNGLIAQTIRAQGSGQNLMKRYEEYLIKKARPEFMALRRSRQVYKPYEMPITDENVAEITTNAQLKRKLVGLTLLEAQKYLLSQLPPTTGFISHQDKFAIKFMNSLSKKERLRLKDDLKKAFQGLESHFQSAKAEHQAKLTKHVFKKQRELSKYIQRRDLRDVFVGAGYLETMNLMTNMIYGLDKGIEYCDDRDRGGKDQSLQDYFGHSGNASNLRELQSENNASSTRQYRQDQDLLNVSCGTDNIPVCATGKGPPYYTSSTHRITCNPK